MKSLLLFSALLFFATLPLTAQKPAPAEKILSAAYKKAKKENKNVFVLFHASWCGWCKKMDASMNDSTVAKHFTDNYVIVHLTIEETPDKKNLENEGGYALKTKYHGATAGLPFWLIMDKKQNLLGDSQVRPAGTPLTAAGSNVGCPADKEGLKHFTELLRKTSSMDDAALSKVSDVFSKNLLR